MVNPPRCQWMQVAGQEQGCSRLKVTFWESRQYGLIDHFSDEPGVGHRWCREVQTIRRKPHKLSLEWWWYFIHGFNALSLVLATLGRYSDVLIGGSPQDVYHQDDFANRRLQLLGESSDGHRRARLLDRGRRSGSALVPLHHWRDMVGTNSLWPVV
jgi:hypothetical protein